MLSAKLHKRPYLLGLKQWQVELVNSAAHWHHQGLGWFSPSHWANLVHKMAAAVPSARFRQDNLQRGKAEFPPLCLVVRKIFLRCSWQISSGQWPGQGHTVVRPCRVQHPWAQGRTQQEHVNISKQRREGQDGCCWIAANSICHNWIELKTYSTCHITFYWLRG